jgi:hypothetical protein
MVIKRIGVGSAAKVAAVLYACIGLFVGAMLALISLAGAGFMAEAQRNSDFPAFIGPLFGVGAIIFLPICYGILGLCIGAVVALIYNAAAGVTGGLELDTQ